MLDYVLYFKFFDFLCIYVCFDDFGIFFICGVWGEDECGCDCVVVINCDIVVISWRVFSYVGSSIIYFMLLYVYNDKCFYFNCFYVCSIYVLLLCVYVFVGLGVIFYLLVVCKYVMCEV